VNSLLELRDELRKLANAERAWADAAAAFNARQCNRTFNDLHRAQIAMAIIGIDLVAYLRNRTPLLNLTTR
jgi:hypothetical protein